MKRELKQLAELKKLGKELRLAADGWDEDWKTLFATILSAQTLDTTTIPVAEELFKEYNSIEKISRAKVEDIKKMIKRINYYKTKSRHLVESSKILFDKYDSVVPIDFEKLIELPGVGRKTANVFLAEKGFSNIGIDTHVAYISKRLGWTKYKDQHKVEKDLQRIFPKGKWKDINWILVRFGQTHRSKKRKNEILDRIRKIR